MKKKSIIIPVFIPELACDHRCVFCNQHAITGNQQIPTTEQVSCYINEKLTQISSDVRNIQIAFFGGNFTGIPAKDQEAYLKAVWHFIDSSRVNSIRISTRPDKIDEDKLQILSHYGVKNIELGVQNMCDEVLQKSGRGHTVDDIIRASELIKKHNFILGMQMMTGLPADSAEKTFHTASEIIRLGAAETRIYPLLVLKFTSLHEQYLSGNYTPLTLDETIERLVPVVDAFENSGVRILRVGLHPSRDFLDGDLVAGPWHPSLRQMIYSRLWAKILSENSVYDRRSILKVPTEQFPNAIGYKRENAIKFPYVQFVSDKTIHGMNYEFHHC